jgi:hypothetical protein
MDETPIKIADAISALRRSITQRQDDALRELFTVGGTIKTLSRLDGRLASKAINQADQLIERRLEELVLAIRSE